MWLRGHVALALSATSCIVGNYSKTYTGTPTSAVVGPTREVLVGVQQALDVAGDDDITIQVTGTALCRQAAFGDIVQSREYVEEPRKLLAGSMVFVGAIASIIGSSLFAVAASGDGGDATTGAVLGVGGTYFLWLGLVRVTQSERSGTDVVARRPGGHEWRGDTQPCTAMAAPAPGVHVLHLEFRFPDSYGYSLDTHTDANGHAVIPRLRGATAEVAASCGPARMTVADTTPGLVGSAPEDTGSPEAVRTFAIAPGEHVEQIAPGPASSALDGLLLATATRCQEQRHARCVAALPSDTLVALHDGCEDTCARLVDVTPCVLARRTCGDAPDCAAKAGSCLQLYGVDPNDLAQCTSTCADRAKENECR